MDGGDGSAARLYIGNIPWSTTVEDLRDLFADCGGVRGVDIPTGRQGRSRGYGLVEFNSEQEAQAAIGRMDGACRAIARLDASRHDHSSLDDDRRRGSLLGDGGWADGGWVDD